MSTIRERLQKAWEQQFIDGQELHLKLLELGWSEAAIETIDSSMNFALAYIRLPSEADAPPREPTRKDFTDWLWASPDRQSRSEPWSPAQVADAVRFAQQYAAPTGIPRPEPTLEEMLELVDQEAERRTGKWPRLSDAFRAGIKWAGIPRDEDARLRKWLNNNTSFYDVKQPCTGDEPNVPTLASVSKRIWYHATDDQVNCPFSAVIDARLAK